MKKDILIICTVFTIFSLTACGQTQNEMPANQTGTAAAKTVAFENTFLNAVDKQLNPNFYYNVQSRFNATISKEKLQNAKSIIDILPKEATELMEMYQNVTVTILHNDGEISKIGKNEVLNNAQINLLQSTDYSTSFYIKADCKTKNQIGEIENYDLFYHMTIVPEVEAKFGYGQDALIDYLKVNSKAQTTIIRKEKLKPGQVNFTVTKEGKITNVILESTSGYPSIDETLVDLITNMPKIWIPATNSKGEKVEQDLVFFFGTPGC
jgi:hypothetical protein